LFRQLSIVLLEEGSIIVSFLENMSRKATLLETVEYIFLWFVDHHCGLTFLVSKQDVIILLIWFELTNCHE